jgi:hypothetical protein
MAIPIEISFVSPFMIPHQPDHNNTPGTRKSSRVWRETKFLVERGDICRKAAKT